MGIFGLGHIGRRIARRAEGFEMTVGYHSRHRRDDVPYAYHDSVATLAEASDVLVVAAPGGAATRHAVNAAVLAALGRDGYLVNIGRGSVVDTAALIAALTAGGIAGAALDVMEGEPTPDPHLLQAPRLVLTPHIGGRSPEATAAGQKLLLDNLAAHFTGRPLPTPVG
jgi:D-3-phosphoglycerate dehydrogenase